MVPDALIFPSLVILPLLTILPLLVIDPLLVIGPLHVNGPWDSILGALMTNCLPAFNTILSGAIKVIFLSSRLITEPDGLRNDTRFLADSNSIELPESSAILTNPA